MGWLREVDLRNPTTTMGSLQPNTAMCNGFSKLIVRKDL